MATAKLWTREELLVAFMLYSKIPSRKFDDNNNEIIYYANLIGRTPAALAMKLSNISSLNPYLKKSGRKGLTNTSINDRKLWQEMSDNTEIFINECQKAMSTLEDSIIPPPIKNNDIYIGRERESIVKTRVDQNIFRRNVLETYNYRCCLTGLDEPELLVASHIIPWSKSVGNRLDPSNGLCLSSLHDKAFDRGLITFNENYELVLSNKLKKSKRTISIDNFEKYEGMKINLPLYNKPSQENLDYHRKNIFEKKQRSMYI